MKKTDKNKDDFVAELDIAKQMCELLPQKINSVHVRGANFSGAAA